MKRWHKYFLMFAAGAVVLIGLLPAIGSMWGAWDIADIEGMILFIILIILMLAGWPLLTAIVTWFFLRRSVLQTALATLVSILLPIAAIAVMYFLASHWEWVNRSVPDCVFDSLLLFFVLPYALVLALFTVHVYRVLGKRKAN